MHGFDTNMFLAIDNKGFRNFATVHR